MLLMVRTSCSRSEKGGVIQNSTHVSQGDWPCLQPGRSQSRGPQRWHRQAEMATDMGQEAIPFENIRSGLDLALPQFSQFSSYLRKGRGYCQNTHALLLETARIRGNSSLDRHRLGTSAALSYLLHFSLSDHSVVCFCISFWEQRGYQTERSLRIFQFQQVTGCSWVIVIRHSLANGRAAHGSYMPVPGVTRYKCASRSLGLGLGLGQFPSPGCVRGRSCHSRTEVPLELGARADSA